MHYAWFGAQMLPIMLKLPSWRATVQVFKVSKIFDGTVSNSVRQMVIEVRSSIDFKRMRLTKQINAGARRILNDGYQIQHISMTIN